MTLTTKAILDLLPIVADRGWRIRNDGAVRDRDDRCPVCALVHELSRGTIDMTVSAVRAMRQLGYDSAGIYSPVPRVMDAADIDHGSGSDRKPLLRALGLAQ